MSVSCGILGSSSGSSSVGLVSVLLVVKKEEEVVAKMEERVECRGSSLHHVIFKQRRACASGLEDPI